MMAKGGALRKLAAGVGNESVAAAEALLGVLVLLSHQWSMPRRCNFFYPPEDCT